jgi:hypothetical protein
MSVSLYPDNEFYLINELSALAATAGGNTLTIGHAYQAEIVYADAASINAGIAAVADIDDPTNGADDWTDIIDLSGSKMIVDIYSVAAAVTGIHSFLYMNVQSGEDAGDALRAQILRDGVIIFDAKCVKDAAHTIQSVHIPVYGGTFSGAKVGRIYCNSSFLIRAAREGAIASDNSEFDVGAIAYYKIA